MGSVISSVVKDLKDQDSEAAECAKENLRQCQENAEMVRSHFRLQVQERLKNPGEFQKWQIAGGRQDREDSFVGVATSSTPATSMTEGIDSLVKGIFGVVKGQGGDVADSFHEAITGMASTACNAFLGNTSAGASMHSTFLIVPYGFAFHRVDIFMYKYNFTAKGFTDHYESQTVVYVSRGVLNTSKDLTPDELVSYVSDMYAGNEDKIKEWMKAFNELHKQAKELHASVHAPL